MRKPAWCKERLPRKCECGGRLVYDFSFGHVWVHCASCTPVVTVRVQGLVAEHLRGSAR